MAIHNDELIIKSVERKPRQGWSEAFAKMSELKADKLLLPDNIDSVTFEWVW
jgi:antitoxin MazE